MPDCPIPRSTLRGCADYLNLAATDAKKIFYSYQPGRAVSPVMTAEALVSRQLLGWPRNHPSLIKGAGQVAAHLEKEQRPKHLLLVLRHPAPAQPEEQGLGEVEPARPRGADQDPGQRRHLRRGKLGPLPAQRRPLGRDRRPTLPDLALDPDPRGLLPLSPALPHRRHRRARGRRSSEIQEGSLGPSSQGRAGQFPGRPQARVIEG